MKPDELSRRTGVPVEGVGSSAPLTVRPQGTARAGGLGPHGPHKPESEGRNLGPQPAPIEAAAESVLVWRHQGLGHRLRARSWHDVLIADLRAGKQVTVAHERTQCGIDLPDHVLTALEVDGEVDCAGCLEGRPDHRMRRVESEAA